MLYSVVKVASGSNLALLALAPYDPRKEAGYTLICLLSKKLLSDSDMLVAMVCNLLYIYNYLFFIASVQSMIKLKVDVMLDKLIGFHSFVLSSVNR